MTKTTKGGKVMNPTDSYRKELRKKELKRNKKERKKVREVGILKKDPETLKEQIDKLELMKADGALDKARKHKKRQLEDTLNLVMKKRKEYEEKMREKGETPVMFSHLGPPRRRTSAEEERANHPKPEDSVYYHPTLNPTGAPPPGKPPMFKSSIGPRIPLSDSSASTSVAGSSSVPGSEDDSLAIPPPPPPPPLPDSDLSISGDTPALPVSLPLPPPPPLPPMPPVANASTMLPPPPPGPPPRGLPPNKQIPDGTQLPPPPPLPSAQPPAPGISGSDRESNTSSLPDQPAAKNTIQESGMPPLPPPPPGPPPKSASNQPDGIFENDASNLSDNWEISRLVPPPPPPGPRPPPPGLRPGVVPTLQADVLPPGVLRFPPPPPNHPLSVPGLTPQGTLHGVMVPPLMPRPPYGPPPGLPPMMRPPLPPGPPPTMQDGELVFPQPPMPAKPSYVKSAAPTVVKRPLAQHTPELTSMVPASVRVRRESALPKSKPKPSVPTTVAAPRASAATVAKPVVTSSSSSAPKPQSIDDSYTAFLEDMKALGALDG